MFGASRVSPPPPPRGPTRGTRTNQLGDVLGIRLDRQIECRLVGVAASPTAGTGAKENPNHLRVALRGGGHQSRRVAGAGLVDVRASLDEQANEFGLAESCGEDQRRIRLALKLV